MKPFTLHLQAFLVPSVGPHKLIRPVIPNLSGLVVGTASSPDSHRKRASHRVSHLGILRSPAQGPLRWPLCLPRPHLMCWGCGCPQTLGPEAWGLGGWVPHSASGPRARPEKGRNTGEEGTPKHEAPYDTAWLQRMKWTGHRSIMGRGRKPFPKQGEWVEGQADPSLPPRQAILTPQSCFHSLWLCSPWRSWEVPPVVGMDKGKGQRSPLLPSHWGRSSFWPAEQEAEGWGLHRDLSRKKLKVGRGWGEGAAQGSSEHCGTHHEGRPGGHGGPGCS